MNLCTTNGSRRLPSRRSELFAAAVALAVGFAGPLTQPAFAGPQPQCYEIDAHVDYRGVAVDPPHPRVGDQVRIAFDVDVFVYSAGPSQLTGTEPFLSGETLEYTGHNPSFLLTAEQPGTATLSLTITYLTERACVGENGFMYYDMGSYHGITLPSFDLQVAGDGSCPGDCDAGGSVTVDEIVRAILVALGDDSVESCSSLDRDGDGNVAVDDIVAAVNAALNGCPG